MLTYSGGQEGDTGKAMDTGGKNATLFVLLNIAISMTIKSLLTTFRCNYL